ncbi:MAG: HIT domain-containing protein [Parachlamydiales bacterium]|nr:HIT domain-containing protein [Parachlamydiales bacterium]
MRIVWFVLCSFCLYAQEILWQGPLVSLIEDQGLPAVVMNREASLDKLTDEEKIAFERTVGKMQNVFEEVFGFGDFSRWLPLEKEKLTAYLIPSGAYAGPNEVDYVIKIQSLLFALKDHDMPPLTKEQIARIQEAASRMLSKEMPTIPIQEGNFKCTQILKGVSIALDELHETMDLPEEDPPFTLNFTTRCRAFCDPKILEKQFVFDSSCNHILYNHRPYVDCHFMILPIRHVSTLSETSEIEILDKFLLLSQIETISQKEFGSPRMGLLTRIGWRGGQTQSHFHEHVIGFDPKEEQAWLRNWIYELNGTLLPIDPIKWEKIRTIFKTALTSVQ